MNWIVIPLGLCLDTVVEAAGRLGLEVIPTGPQPAEVILPIEKELALTKKHSDSIKGGSGRLLLVRHPEGQIHAVWDADNNKGGVPGHIGVDGGRLAQTTASIMVDKLSKAEPLIPTQYAVTRDGTIIRSFKDKE